jgi:hypothetical protein
MYPRQFRSGSGALFTSKELRVHLNEQLEALRMEVERLTAEDLADRERVIVALQARYEFTTPLIHADRRRIGELTEGTTEVEDGFFQRRVKVRVTEVCVYIPFDGDPDLLQMRPSQFRMSGMPRASTRDHEIVLTNAFRDIPDNEAIQRWYHGEVDAIRFYLNAIQTDLAAHQRAVRAVVPELVDARIARLDALRSLRDTLDLGDVG